MQGETGKQEDRSAVAQQESSTAAPPTRFQGPLQKSVRMMMLILAALLDSLDEAPRESSPSAARPEETAAAVS